MLNRGKIKLEDYNFLCNEIKTKMDKWRTECADFKASGKLYEPDPCGPMIFF